MNSRREWRRDPAFGAREDPVRAVDTNGARGGERYRILFSDQSLLPKAQRSTSNAQLSIQKIIERWALSVERWTFSVCEMNSYTHALTTKQAAELRALLDESGFQFAPKPYTIFFAQKNKLSVAVYEKGPKVLLQGKGVEEFVQFELEPKILGEAKLGYEEVHSPEMFEPHFGVDESGKGDFFGPLVISGVYVDAGIARKLLDAGVQDSKRIGSDARIRALADTIRKSSLGLFDTVLIGPAKYNELYEKFGNLNSLLGWGHARVIENLLAKKPDCPRSLSDQFADARVIERSLLRHGRKIDINNERKPSPTWPSRPLQFWREKRLLIGWIDKERRSGCAWNEGFRRM